MKMKFIYRRIEEGEVVLDMESVNQAQKMLFTELACNNIPPKRVENIVIDVQILSAEEKEAA